MFTIQYAKAQNYNNLEHTEINLIVKFEEFNEELPFLAMTTDPEPHGRELFARANAGEFGEVRPYVVPPTIPVTELK